MKIWGFKTHEAWAQWWAQAQKDTCIMHNHYDNSIPS